MARSSRNTTLAIFAGVAAIAVSAAAASCGGKYGGNDISTPLIQGDAEVDAVTVVTDAATDPTTAPDAAAADGAVADGAAADAADAGASDASDAGPACPCFTVQQVTAVDLSAGSRICVVDSMGGGTTQTILIKSLGNRRYAAEALYNASLPGSDLACGFGCLDDTPGDGIDDCAGLPAYVRTDDISTAQHATCRAAIAPRCN